MSSRFGPIRLIALHCGKFDYAEIELDRPLHLVGPNNVGKTSLIALLQFLYLDNQKSMRFSRDLQESRKYYFPGVHSYALFECLTPTGYQTIGVHGCGPIKQYNVERFAYMGRYDASLFLDGNHCVRAFDAIKADLSAKNYTPLSGDVLRAALTGVGDGHRVMLGLVPSKNRDTYASFKELFCNILRLSHIRQDEMKQLLLSLFAKSFHQPKGIDLAKTYRENFERVKRDSKAVQMLKDLVPDIERALQHRTKRDAARGRLPGLYRGIMDAAQAVSHTLQQERAATSSRLARIEEELEKSEHDLQDVQEKMLGCEAELTRLKVWFAETQTLETALSDFLPDWCAQRIQEIGKRTDELARRLGNLHQEPVEQVEARVTRLRNDLQRLRERLGNIEQASIQWLRKRYSDEEISELFRLLNPELLGLSTDTSGTISLRDTARLEASLQQLMRHCEGGVYEDNGIRINLDELQAPSCAAYGDPENIRDEISRIEMMLQRDEELCRDAKEADVLRREKEEIEKEKLALLRRQEQYEQFCERKAQLAGYREKQDETIAQKADLKNLQSNLKESMRDLTLEQQTLQRDLERIVEREKQTSMLIADIAQPPADWSSSPAEPIKGDLEDLVARYKKDYFDQQRQDEALRETLGSIEERTYSRYAGADETESLQRLADARAALPEKERAATELWKGIAVGIRENLQNMGADLETLRVKINGVNRGLASINVSNLKSIRLAIVENPQWTKRIKNIKLQDDMPLFAEKGASDAAFEEIGRLLSERSRIELGDLFNLEFEITMPDDTVRRYPHLDRIESNGTTIAIKVLVNLSLLKQLLDNAEVSIPFYLDECSSLDSENLKAIVKTAEDMGFVAVLASPEAMEAATRIYFINEQSNGRVVLNPKHALVECLDADMDTNGEQGA